MASKPESLTNRPVAKFLTALFKIVNEADDAIIGWDESGTRFIVKDVDRLQDEVLPLHFRSKKFSSTCRQVGTPCVNGCAPVHSQPLELGCLELRLAGCFNRIATSSVAPCLVFAAKLL
jgi:hypothetical protein